MQLQEKKALINKLGKLSGDPRELEQLIGYDLEIDISHRGGGLGFRDSDIENLTGIDAENLPGKFGAYCNYLGGGLRGSINGSGYNKSIAEIDAELLEAIQAACISTYNWIEAEAGLQEEEDEAGEVNWENVGTAASRRAGIVSAY